MELQLQSCQIRPWSLSDAVALQRHADNRAIWQHLRDIFPHPYTLEDARAFLLRVTSENPAVTFAIAKPSGEAIGCIGLHMGCDVHSKTAELGYWLGEPFWRRGIMSEAVFAFTRWAFGAFPLERIYAETFANNTASVRVLEKSGFVPRGACDPGSSRTEKYWMRFYTLSYETRPDPRRLVLGAFYETAVEMSQVRLRNAGGFRPRASKGFAMNFRQAGDGVFRKFLVAPTGSRPYRRLAIGMGLHLFRRQPDYRTI